MKKELKTKSRLSLHNRSNWFENMVVTVHRIPNTLGYEAALPAKIAMLSITAATGTTTTAVIGGTTVTGTVVASTKAGAVATKTLSEVLANISADGCVSFAANKAAAVAATKAVGSSSSVKAAAVAATKAVGSSSVKAAAVASTKAIIDDTIASVTAADVNRAANHLEVIGPSLTQDLKEITGYVLSMTRDQYTAACTSHGYTGGCFKARLKKFNSKMSEADLLDNAKLPTFTNPEYSHFTADTMQAVYDSRLWFFVAMRFLHVDAVLLDTPHTSLKNLWIGGAGHTCLIFLLKATVSLTQATAYSLLLFLRFLLSACFYALLQTKFYSACSLLFLVFLFLILF
jgi:hypothetical protein